MNDTSKGLQQSALAMRIIGWGLIVGLPVGLVYPPGFMWGSNPAGFPFICWQHPPSPYDGLHPYVFMIVALYIAWAVLMIRGAKDPRVNAALFDSGILANLLHAGLMIPQAFIYPNEHAHLWADAVAGALEKRARRGQDRQAFGLGLDGTSCGPGRRVGAREHPRGNLGRAQAQGSLCHHRRPADRPRVRGLGLRASGRSTLRLRGEWLLPMACQWAAI